MGKRQLHLEIDTDILEKVQRISDLTGISVKAITTQGLAQYINQYLNSDGEFKPIKAKCIRIQEIDLNTGHASYYEDLCYVLNERTIMGQPYYTILYNGSISHVPQSTIEIIE